MKADMLRQKFLDFFKSKEHVLLPSSSLVPENDPTAMFNVAGMQPLVPYLMGKPHPDGGMLSNSQKCFRTVDIDEVGDNRHCTFFEMLGNWSLGTYFKKEAISWSFEFLTKELGMDPARLLATVYEGGDVVPKDEESIALWIETGIPEERIFPCPAEENWWPDYGAKGPCGPDSEIYYDLKPGAPHTNPAYDDDRYIEIWNLVFMEYYCDGDGTFTKLEKKNVDTGGGFERFLMVLQEKETVYETDLYETYIAVLEKELGIPYGPSKKAYAELTTEEQEQTKRMRIIMDHVRAATHLIGDGVSPTNEGAGYVLRRIIRRAVFSHVLLDEEKEVDFTKLVDAVIAVYKETYPVLSERREVILSTLAQEVEKFMQTLKKGRKMLEEQIVEVKKVRGAELSGKDAFTLYDTFGFPLSLTEEIAALHDVSVDVDGFAAAMKEQQERSRAGSGDKFERGKENVQTMLADVAKTVYEGYALREDGKPLMRLEDCTIIKAISLGNRELAVVTDRTVFYAESGGQVGDTGAIFHGDFHIKITDTQKYDDVWVHFGELDGGSEREIVDLEGAACHMQVDEAMRLRIMASHTGAHLLHKALQKYLGDEVEQAGSYVDAYRTRFDFNFPRAVTANELMQIEQEVNDAIARWEPVVKQEMSMERAKDMGAIGLFTEKYGDEVRVCAIGEGYSTELCGGIHVGNTSEIGIAKIVKESAIASGIRRVEMITGVNVYERMKEEARVLDQAMELTKANTFEEVPDKVDALKTALKTLEKEYAAMKKDALMKNMDALMEQVQDMGEHKVLMAELDTEDMGDLKQIAGTLKSKDGIDAGLLYSPSGQFVVFSKVDSISAKDVLSTLQELGGRGGGSDAFAQGVNVDVKQLGNIDIFSK